MKYKLGECIEEIVDKTTENNQYEVLSVTKDGIYSQEEFFKKQIASEDNTGYKIIRKNNLVFSTMNLWMGSLDVLSNYEIGIVSPAYKIFKFDESKMTPSFGKYFMKSHFMLEQYKNCSEQGASVVRRNLDLKQLLDTEIIIPTVEEQCKIVKVLENIDEIINKYTNLIKNKDQFIKNQFVEMFNPDSYEKTRLQNLCELITKGTTPTTVGFEFVSEGINFIKIESLKENGTVDTEMLNYINVDCNEKLKRSQLHENDILFSIAGAIGKTCIIKKDILPANTNQALAIIRLKNQEIILADFLLSMLTSSYIVGQYSLQKKGQAQNNISLNDLNELEIYLPSIIEQKKWIKFLNLMNKQKYELEKQKQNYIDLKKGLMQQLLTGKVRIHV